jgi:signal transduction histidine kinase
MTFELNAFSLALLFAGLATIYMSALILKRFGWTVRSFGFLLLALSLWVLSYGAELASTTLEQMLFFIKMEYIGISLLPVLWMIFIIQFTGKEKWLTNKYLYFVFSPALVSIFLVWTNKWHRLHYTATSIDYSGPFPLLDIAPGPWYYFFTAYFYAMLAWGIFLMLSRFRKADPIYQKQYKTILLSALVPWIVNISYLMNARPYGHIDLTPYAFIITGFIISIGLLRFKLFDIIPVAREKVIEVMREGVLVIDAAKRIIYMNEEMKKISAGQPPIIIGEKIHTLFAAHPILLELVAQHINGEVEIDIPNGIDDRYLEVNVSPFFEKSVVYTGAILLFRDITDKKTAALKLKQQAEELLALNHVKDKIFSIISHDMRTPLGNLREILRLMDEEVLTEDEFKSFIPHLHNNIGYTYDLLENLLHWSKSQLKGDIMRQTIFDLQEIAVKSSHFFESKAHKKGIHLKNEIQENTKVFADIEMIHSTIRNLITNAIKFCNSGDTITIFASIEEDFTTICIQDTGIGIPPENLEKLMNQASFTTRGTDNEQGTGLGFILCKDFVEKNGGRIWVESTLKEGSRFYFTLRTAPSSLSIQLPVGTKNTA